jgi:tetratricopeptide (TPR) repeat protein
VTFYNENAYPAYWFNVYGTYELNDSNSYKEIANKIVEFYEWIESNPDVIKKDNTFNDSKEYRTIEQPDPYAQLAGLKLIDRINHPTTENEWISNGERYADKGDYANAINSYTEAITLNPNNTKAYDKRGDAFYKSGKVEQALIDYENALKINPSGSTNYYYRAKLCDDNGLKKDAVSFYKLFLTYLPSYQRNDFIIISLVEYAEKRIKKLSR